MRSLENPTTKNKKTHIPQSHFRWSLLKKGKNPSDSRRGGVGKGEKLMDFRQPGSPGGGRGKEETRGNGLHFGGESEGREKSREGTIKTLKSNLVYWVKKSHMHSRPQGSTLLLVWPEWAPAPGLIPLPSQAGAELCRCSGRPSASLPAPLLGEGLVDRP